MVGILVSFWGPAYFTWLKFLLVLGSVIGFSFCSKKIFPKNWTPTVSPGLHSNWSQWILSPRVGFSRVPGFYGESGSWILSDDRILVIMVEWKLTNKGNQPNEKYVFFFLGRILRIFHSTNGCIHDYICIL